MMRRSVDRQTRTAPNGGAGRVPSVLRRLRGERGAAMVETAIVLPIVLALVVGVFEFGRGLNYWLDANHLASEGARLAAVDSNPPGGLDAYLRGQATTAELRTGLHVCIVVGGAGETGDPVTVKVSTAFDSRVVEGLMTLLGPFRSGSGSIDIVGDATMRLERPPQAILAGVAPCA